MRIMIADNDEDVVVFLKEAITKIIDEYELFTAGDGVECLSFLKRNRPPDLIFLNLNMPLRSGVECLQIIRRNYLSESTSIIIYSELHNMRDIDKCYKSGADFYMVKPDTVCEAVNMIEGILNQLGRREATQRLKNEFVIMSRKDMIS